MGYEDGGGRRLIGAYRFIWATGLPPIEIR